LKQKFLLRFFYKIMKLLIATGNAGKLAEIKEFLGVIPELELLSLKDVQIEKNDCEETGDTFEENARQKAEYFFEKTGLPVLAEDSGIKVEALKGELGVKTRRWGAGENATDQEWMDFFLERMKNEKNRNAEFFCSACVYLGENNYHIFSGKCEGKVLQKSNVPLQKGIPLSSYFVPEGKQKVFSFLSKAEKTQISHRGMAMKQVYTFLKQL
jgi:XTP/dITP diphosphohydrolase